MNSPIPPLAALYEELQSAQIALAALHRALAERVRCPIDRRAHQTAAERIDLQIQRFARLQEGQ